MLDGQITFGEYIVAKRLEKDISLRKMAELLDYSAAYWSEVEKGKKNPPSLDKLQQIAKILSLTDEETTQLYDLAMKKRDTIPPDIPAYISENEIIKVALRTARDLGADEEDWKRFINDLKDRRRPDSCVFHKFRTGGFAPEQYIFQDPAA